MKTAMKLLLMLVVLVLAACTEEATPAEEKSEPEVLRFEWSSEQEIPKHLAYEVKNLVQTAVVSAPNSQFLSTIFEAEDPEMPFVDLVVEVKNLKQEKQLVTELLDIRFLVNDQEYPVLVQVEKRNGSQFEDGEYKSIEPLTSTIVHYIASVPTLQPEDELVIQATMNEDVYETTLSLKEFEASRTNITIGDQLEVPQYAKLELTDVYYTDGLYPPDTSGFHTYYTPESENNTYLILEMLVENLKSSDLPSDTIVAAKVTYERYYEYTGSSTLLGEDETDFDNTSITSIASLNEKKLFYLLEVPKELVGKEAVVSIWFNDDYHYLSIPGNLETREPKTSNQVAQEEPEEEQTQQNSSPSENTSEEEESEFTSSEPTIRKGHNAMTEQEVLDLISYNEGIDFSTHTYEMYLNSEGYLIIEVGQGEMAVGTYKIDSDGTLLQFDVTTGSYHPAQDVEYGGS